MAVLKQKFGFVVLNYLRLLAKIQLLKNKKADIIGITGSIGKTSVRNAITQVLETKYTVKTTGKANSESGIPLDILGLEMNNFSAFDWLRVILLAPLRLLTNWERFDKYVVEMAVDDPHEPKNMSYLLKIFRPHTGVFINVAAVHTEQFDHLVEETDPDKRAEKIIDLIAIEKGKMIRALPRNGYAILNTNDKRIKEFAHQTDAKVLTVGEGDATVEIGDLQISLDGFSVELEYEGQEADIKIPDQVLSKAYGVTFGLAVAVGIAHGIEIDEAAKALQTYKLPPGRMTLIQGINNSHILDSSYNASKISMLETLDTLDKVAGDRPKLAVLGDMRELGEEAQREHIEVARRAVKTVDTLILVGPLMKKYFLPEASRLGFPKDQMHWFANSAQAADFAKDHIQGGEVFLVKGSQNTIFLERVVEAIMAQPKDSDTLLCRRGEYWDNQRAKYI